MIGSFNLDLQSLWPNAVKGIRAGSLPKESLFGWYEVKNAKNEVCGELQVSVRVSKGKEDVSSQISFNYTDLLTVRVVEGRNIKSRDNFGAGDPYVSVSWYRFCIYAAGSC